MNKLTKIWHNEPLRVIYVGLSSVGILLAASGLVDWGDAMTAIGTLVVGLEGGRSQVSPVKK